MPAAHHHHRIAIHARGTERRLEVGRPVAHVHGAAFRLPAAVAVSGIRPAVIGIGDARVELRPGFVAGGDPEGIPCPPVDHPFARTLGDAPASVGRARVLREHQRDVLVRGPRSRVQQSERGIVRRFSLFPRVGACEREPVERPRLAILGRVVHEATGNGGGAVPCAAGAHGHDQEPGDVEIDRVQAVRFLQASLCYCPFHDAAVLRPQPATEQVLDILPVVEKRVLIDVVDGTRQPIAVRLLLVTLPVEPTASGECPSEVRRSRSAGGGHCAAHGVRHLETDTHLALGVVHAGESEPVLGRVGGEARRKP